MHLWWSCVGAKECRVVDAVLSLWHPYQVDVVPAPADRGYELVITDVGFFDPVHALAIRQESGWIGRMANDQRARGASWDWTQRRECATRSAGSRGGLRQLAGECRPNPTD